MAISSFLFSSSSCPTTARQLTCRCMTPHPSHCLSRSGAQVEAPTKQLSPRHQSKTLQLSCTIPSLTHDPPPPPPLVIPSLSLTFCPSCVLKSPPPKLMFVMAALATRHFLLHHNSCLIFSLSRRLVTTARRRTGLRVLNREIHTLP
jgi:hypothetical protein